MTKDSINLWATMVINNGNSTGYTVQQDINIRHYK
jgi:hypothetical protein